MSFYSTRNLASNIK